MSKHLLVFLLVLATSDLLADQATPDEASSPSQTPASDNSDKQSDMRVETGGFGDTEEGYTRRFGAPESQQRPLPPATVAKLYRVNGWLLIIQFWKGVAHVITYMRADGWSILDGDKKNILPGANAGLQWVADTPGEGLAPDGSRFSRYIRSDNRYRAIVSDKSVTVGTEEFYEVRAPERAAEVAEGANKRMSDAHRQSLEAEINALRAEQGQIEARRSEGTHYNDIYLRGGRVPSSKLLSTHEGGRLDEELKANQALIDAKERELDALMGRN
jgi:hypothetical protein